MGGCCSNSAEDKEISSPDAGSITISKLATPGTQGGDIKLNVQQLAALLKVQSFFRALLARKKVNKIRSETYAVQYNENGDVVNYDNPSV